MGCMISISEILQRAWGESPIFFLMAKKSIEWVSDPDRMYQGTAVT